ncbi:MAG TPA: SpoIIE family protein phosphatase, partial [Longimicrobium sp.]|nr:SpoIIE family protein phosphatase [Longimicrobium sp.]
FRTTVLISMLILVAAIGSITVAAVALIVERAARQDVLDGLERSHRVFESSQAYRQRLYQAQAQLLAEEPRLRAAVTTVDVTPETVMGVARELRRALQAQVLVVTDGNGQVLADPDDTTAAGQDFSHNPLIQTVLRGRESTGEVWIARDQAFQVQAHPVGPANAPHGVVALGYRQDEEVAQTVFEQTGSAVAVTLDGKVLTASMVEPGKRLEPARLSEALVPVLAAGGDPVVIKLDGRQYLASAAPFPGYKGKAVLQVAVVRSLDQALGPVRRLTRAMVLLLLLAATGAALVAAAMSRRLSKPLDALADWMDAIVRGERMPPDEVTNGPLEVRELGRALDRMVAELDDSRKQLSEKERLEREMEIAAHLQLAILPRELKVEGLEIAARMAPATDVGGDYYDVVPVPQGAFIGIGDVAGHGLTAGVVMLMIQNVTSALVRTQPDARPRDLVVRLNEVIYENVRKRLRRNEHATYSLFRYRTDGKVVYAGAHEELVVFRAATGRCERLPVQGTWLGAMKNVDRFTVDQELQLNPGDVLVLYTDGLTEAMSPAGEQFGVERLCTEVERLHAGTTEQICEALFQQVKAWSPQLGDDVTLLALRYLGPPAAQA